MMPTRLAIDLSGNVIRVLAGTPGGPMRAADATMPVGAMSNGGVVNAAAIGSVIKDLVAHLDARDARAMVVASDAIASFRVLSFARDTADAKIDAAFRAVLPADGNRIGMQRHEVTLNGSERTFYGAAFDRLKVQSLAGAVRAAGLEPSVVELKSLCVTRLVPAPAGVLVDLSVDPAEIFLIDGSLPRVWHTFKARPEPLDEAQQLASAVNTVIVFHQRMLPGGGFSAEAPVFITADGPVSAPVVEAMRERLRRPMHAVPPPARVAPEIRYGPYMACLGLVMRRR
jgi:hypothetical protein